MIYDGNEVFPNNIPKVEDLLIRRQFEILLQLLDLNIYMMYKIF